MPTHRPSQPSLGFDKDRASKLRKNADQPSAVHPRFARILVVDKDRVIVIQEYGAPAKSGIASVILRKSLSVIGART